jgi:hypothetical protein
MANPHQRRRHRSSSVGIVFASIPYLPHPPPRTIQTPVTHDIRGGTQKNPGIYSLTLRGVSSSDNFAIGVNVTNGVATFCVMPETNFITWTFNSQSISGGTPFSFDSCILNVQTAQTTLRFTPTSQGNWDVVSVNTQFPDNYSRLHTSELRFRFPSRP